MKEWINRLRRPVCWLLIVGLITGNVSYVDVGNAYGATEKGINVSITEEEIKEVLEETDHMGLEFRESRLPFGEDETSEELVEQLEYLTSEEGWLLLKSEKSGRQGYLILGYKEDGSEFLMDQLQLVVMNAGKATKNFTLHTTGKQMNVMEGELLIHDFDVSEKEELSTEEQRPDEETTAAEETSEARTEDTEDTLTLSKSSVKADIVATALDDMEIRDDDIIDMDMDYMLASDSTSQVDTKLNDEELKALMAVPERRAAEHLIGLPVALEANQYATAILKVELLDEDDLNQKITDAVTVLYGNPGEADATGTAGRVAEASIVRLNENNNQIKPGTSELSYEVQIKLAGIDTFYYSLLNSNEPLFDKYENTMLYLSLPSDFAVDWPTGFTPSEIRENSDKTEYTIRLEDSDNAQNINIDLSITVDGNGSTPVGTIYEIEPSDVRISTEFHIINRITEAPVEGLKYKRSYEGKAPDPLRTVTDDEWNIRKTVTDQEFNTDSVSPKYEYDKEKNQVSIYYQLEIGLKDSTDKGILTDPEAYGRIGRAPMKQFELTDNISVVNMGGETVLPDSFTIMGIDGKTIQEVHKSATLELSDVQYLNQCSAYPEIKDDVAADAPYLTVFHVVANYPADRFLLNFTDDTNIDDQDIYTIENHANISWEFETAPGTPSIAGNADDAASVVVKEIREPGSVKIYKKITQSTDGTNLEDMLYDRNLAPLYGGYAGFKLERKGDAGDWSAVDSSEIRIHKDGRYEKLPSGIICVNPGNDDGEIELFFTPEGYIQIYLPEGEYRATETKAPLGTKISSDEKEFIIENGKAAEDVTFTNKATTGVIEFKKVTKGYKTEGVYGDPIPLEGAVFGLYEDAEAKVPYRISGTDVIAKSDSTGTVRFVSPQEGTYYVKEISALGYEQDQKVHKVEVKSCEVVGLPGLVPENTIINKKNTAQLSMAKWIRHYNAEGNYTDQPVRAVSGWDQYYFKIQRTLTPDTDSSWVTVTGLEKVGLGDTSMFTKEVAAKDEKGNSWYYRVVEMFSSGSQEHFIATGKDGSTVTMSADGKEAILDVGILEAESRYTFDMVNIPPAVLELQKYKLSIGENGLYLKTMPSGVRFALYQAGTDNQYKKLGEYPTVQNGLIQTGKLPVVDYDMKQIDYYFEELSPEKNYHIEADASKIWEDEAGTIHNLIGPFNLVHGKAATRTEIWNSTDFVPLLIQKKDSVTGTGIAGVEYVLVKANDRPESIPPDAVYMTTGTDGKASYAQAEPKTTYWIKEVKAQTGYIQDDNWHFITTGDVNGKDTWEDGALNDQIKGDESQYRIVLKNTPMPKVKVVKTLVDSTGIEQLTDGSFSFQVFTKNEDDSMVPYQCQGESVTLTSNDDSVYLPEGTYYLQEADTSLALHPDQIQALYPAGGIVEYINGNVYFKLEVPTGKKNTYTVEIAIKNYLYGSVLVGKQDALTKSMLSGAEIQIFDGNSLVASGTTSGPNGTIVFKNLPAFDKEGKRILYTIKETNPPKDSSGISYNKPVVAEYSTYLIPGTTISKAVEKAQWAQDTNSQPLVFQNEPPFSLKVSKIWQDDWNYQFNPVNHKLGNVELALFEKTTEDTLTFVKTAKTRQYDGLGVFASTMDQVLDRTKTYYVFEVSAPEGIYPPEGKKFLDDVSMIPGSTMALSKANDYNYSVYNGESEAERATTTVATLKHLVNNKPWAQFTIQKICDGNHFPNESTKVHKLNGAKFRLYEQLNTPEDMILTVPTGDTLESEQYRVVANYETGTKLDPETHEQRIGEFDSHILEYGKIYWLVETQAPGGFLLPENALIIPIIPAGYTVKEVSNPLVYEKNKTTTREVENQHDSTGLGSGGFAARVKLNKWLEKRENDIPSYTPLGGVTYELWLADSSGKAVGTSPVTTMVTGLNSVASEGGVRTGEVLSESIDIMSLWKSWENAPSNPITPIYTEENTKEIEEFRLSFILKETNAPEGIRKDLEDHVITMTVKSGEGETIDQTYYYVENVEERTRLINWPLSNYQMVIRKYGYLPTSDTMGKTEWELDQSLVLTEAMAQRPEKGFRVPLPNIEMVIQQKSEDDGKWNNYPLTDSNKTDNQGVLNIEGGLPKGSYRLKEKLTKGQEAIYDTLYSGNNDDSWRYFEMTEKGGELHIYNPAWPLVTLQKTDLSDRPISGVKFRFHTQKNQNGVLSDVGGNDFYTFGATAENGMASRHMSGSMLGKAFRVGESSVPSGVSEYYFNHAKTPVRFSIGYTKSKAIQENNPNVSWLILNKPDFGEAAPYADDASIEIKIRNPKTADFVIEKKDYYNRAKGVAGAEFKVFFHPFEVETNGKKYTIRDTGRPSADGVGWIELTGTYISDSAGKVSVNNVTPGWYRIEETIAPNGYTIPDESIQVIAVNSDLTVGSGGILEREEAVSATIFYDKPFIPVTITKELSFKGYAGIQEELKATYMKDALKRIRFQVYRGTASAAFERADVYSWNGTTYEKATDNAITVTEDTGGYHFTGYLPELPDGENYFVKEVIAKGTPAWFESTPESEYVQISITPDDQENNRLKGALTVTNQIGMASVTIFKYDGDAEGKNTPVSDAEFKVFKTKTTTGDRDELSDEVTSAVVKDHKNGTYTITVPADAAPATYYIQESKAPDTFVLSHAYLTVELKAGDEKSYQVEGDVLKLANSRGMAIYLKKYDNISSKVEDQSLLNGAMFILYYKSGPEKAWQEYSRKITGQDGSATGEAVFRNIQVPEGWSFAIGEDNRDNALKDYQLESIYQGEDDRVALMKSEIPFDGDKKDVYVIDTERLTERADSETRMISLYAYNQPPVEVKLVKTALNSDTAPITTFEITSKTDVLFRKRVTTKAEQSGGKQSATIALQPGEYHVKEVFTTSPYTIVKDHADVVWEQDITVPSDGTRNIVVSDFVNIQTAVEPLLEKTTSTSKVQSLFTSDNQTLQYEVTPGLKDRAQKGDVPLTEFIVHDTGLVMKNNNGKTLLDSEYSKDQYNVTTVTIHGPSEEMVPYINKIKGADSVTPVVKAKVSFYGFDAVIEDGMFRDEPICSTTIETRPGTSTVVTPEQGYTYRGFSVQYFDEGLLEKTRMLRDGFEGYALGSAFNPGTIDVEMNLKKQPQKFADGTYAEAVAQIENHSKERIAYLNWNTVGTSQIVSGVASDIATTVVNGIKGPRVKIEKQSSAEGQLTTGQEFDYTVTLTNLESDDDSPSMEDPVIVDKLPLGVTIKSVKLSGTDLLSFTDSERPYSTIEMEEQGNIRNMLRFPLSGELKANQSVTLTLRTAVDSSIFIYGENVQNIALATTRVKGTAAFKDNPKGAVFKTTDGLWPGEPQDELVKQAVEQGLIREDNGYISSTVKNTIATKGGVTLYKEVSGDKDVKNETRFFTSNGDVGRVSNGGNAIYNLYVYNDNTTSALTGLRVGDLLPVQGDTRLKSGSDSPRNSDWNLTFKGISGIYLNGKTPLDKNQYRVWVTSQEYDAAKEGLIGEAGFLGGNPSALGSNWTVWNGEDVTGITGIALEIIDVDFSMKPQEYLKIVYNANVPQYGDEEFTETAYKLAVADFSARYKEIKSTETVQRPLLNSNTCQLMMEPVNVGVGGRIWIDANNNGIQETGEYELLRLPSIQDKLSQVEVTLQVYSGKDQKTVMKYDKSQSSEESWNGRFEFHNLSPAGISDESKLYIWNPGIYSNLLNISALRGSKAASNYVIQIEKPDGLELAKKTSWNVETEAGKSVNPLTLKDGGINYNQALDSNYWAETDLYRSENFFLWNTPAADYDKTKDLGLVPYRNITITKADSFATPLRGAEFAIYGPFERDVQVGAEEIGETSFIGKGTTDSNGKLIIGDSSSIKLLEFMQYVVVETKPAEGYLTSGSNAVMNQGSGLQKITSMNSAWILPSKSDAELTVTDQITVTNQYGTGSASFKKIDSVDASSLAGATFRLTWVADQEMNQQNSAGAQASWADFSARFVAGKTDSSGVKEIKANEGDSVQFQTTGESFGTVLKGLPYGSYTLEEIQAPDGYLALQPQDNRREFTIHKSQTETIDLGRIENKTAPFKFAFRKTLDLPDGTTAVQGDVKFRVEGPGKYNTVLNTFERFRPDDDAGTGEFTSNADGVVAVGNLNYGDYKITELMQTNAGEALYEDRESFYIRIQMATGEMTLLTEKDFLELENESVMLETDQYIPTFVVHNKPLTGRLELEKVDADTRKGISGARFQLEGKAEISEAVWKAYLNQVLFEEGTISDVIKVQTSEGTALQFTMTESETTLYQLPYGSYVLTEISPPDGYVMEKEKPWTGSFMLNDGNKKQRYTDIWLEGILSLGNAVANESHKTNLLKRDSENTQLVLSGAEFVLRTGENYYVVMTQTGDGWEFLEYATTQDAATRIITNSAGIAQIKKLPAGTYEMIETKAPEGYHINSAIPKFTIGNGSHTTIVVTDVAAGGGGTGGDGGGGGGGGNTGGGNQGTSTGTTIVDGEVPLAQLPPIPSEVLIDENVPLAGLPKTGDMVKTMNAIAIMIPTFLTGIYFALQKRRNKES